MKINASIVTYKTNQEELTNCLCSLTQSRLDCIFIIDNSPSNELETFCSKFNKVVYIFNKQNIGYGAAHNIAIKKSIESNVDYHLVLNSDVYFDNGIIQCITKYMEDNQDVAQLIPNTIYPDGKLQYVVRLLPTPANLIFRRFLPKKMVEKMNYRYLLKFNEHKFPMNVPFHMGCFMFFRTSAFKKVGIFDERFFMYTEDIDITRRMHKFYKTMYFPDVTIIHSHKAASYKNLKMLSIHIVNAVRYFNKWGWFFDKERRIFNKSCLAGTKYNK